MSGVFCGNIEVLTFMFLLLNISDFMTQFNRIHFTTVKMTMAIHWAV